AEQNDETPGRRGAGFRSKREVREHALHVRRRDDLEPAPLDERDVGAAEFELEIEGVEARAEEHGHLVERHALLAQLEDALADEARLRLLAAALEKEWPLPRRPLRAQAL